jgi:DNA-binding NtrC family response regulator
LVNVVERAVVLAKGIHIRPEDLPESLRRDHVELDGIGGRLSGGNLKSALTHPERQIILEALEVNGWNRQETARLLGINRTTLYKKMKKFDISYEKHAQI